MTRTRFTAILVLSFILPVVVLATPSGNGQPRTYDIATDTANGVVNTILLEQEIKDEPAIVTPLQEMGTSGDVLSIYFQAVLGSAEIIALDAVVAAHEGTELFDTPQVVNSGTESTNITQTFANKLTLTSFPLLPGTYQLDWQVELSVATELVGTSGVQTRVRIDTGVGPAEVGTAATPFATYDTRSGSITAVVKAGMAPVITLDFRRIGGANTAKVRRARMALFRLDSAGE